MKGVPLRIEIGPRDIENGVLTISIRHSREKRQIPMDQISHEIPKLLAEIHESMYQKALKHVKDNTFVVSDYKEFGPYIEKGGYIKMSVSGEEAELKIKEGSSSNRKSYLG